MNTQKIKDAIDLLNTALNDSIDDVAPVVLSVELTNRDIDVLRYVCLTSNSVPRVVASCYMTSEPEVRTLLTKLKDAVEAT